MAIPWPASASGGVGLKCTATSGNYMESTATLYLAQVSLTLLPKTAHISLRSGFLLPPQQCIIQTGCTLYRDPHSPWSHDMHHQH